MESFNLASESCAQLEYALATETEPISLHKSFCKGQDEINEAERKRAAESIRCLKVFYDLPPSVFFNAIHLLDKFLSKVKSHPRYLECISLSCFHLAAALEEISLDAVDLINVSGSCFSLTDLKRMETIIQQKLPLNKERMVTSFNSLCPLHSLCLQAFHHKPNIWSSLDSLTQMLEMLICDSHSVHFKGSHIALSLLFNEMEKSDRCNASVMSWLHQLREFCQITENELDCCGRFVADSIKAYFQKPCFSPQRKLIWKLSPRTLSSLRPSHRIREIMPTINEMEFNEIGSSDGEEREFRSDTNYIISPKRPFQMQKKHNAPYYSMYNKTIDPAKSI